MNTAVQSQKTVSAHFLQVSRYYILALGRAELVSAGLYPSSGKDCALERRRISLNHPTLPVHTAKSIYCLKESVTTHEADVGWKLVRRRRRPPNLKPTHSDLLWRNPCSVEKAMPPCPMASVHQ